MKAKQTIITTAAIIAIAAIGVAVLVLREPGTAVVPTDETAVVKKAAPKIKDVSVPVRAKPAKTSSAKAAKPKRTESVGTAVGEKAVEAPKADGVDVEKKAQDDNPFPRYLDMFKNDPAALVVEYEKEAEADRANQRKMRDWAIGELKLNDEQVAVFEKAMDGLRDAVKQLTQEGVDLILNGQLNEETAADGAIWSSNILLSKKSVAARNKMVQDTAEELYELLNLEGVSDSVKQRVLERASYITSFSYECAEPNLQVYDKVYKNMGFGDGIFSWCKRQSQKK
jgi:hypothetical protein